MMSTPSERADAREQMAIAQEAVASNPLDIYNKIIGWYTERPQFHGLGLLFFVLLALAGVLSARFGWLHMETTCTLHGYVLYTPVYWVLGFINWLLFAFTFRYSRLSGSIFDRARTWIQKLLSPFIQWALVLATLAVLVYEVTGLTHDFTLSSELRNLTLHSAIAYWVFGVVAGALAGVLIDVQVPQLIRLMLVVWVATLAHVFWWITPPNPHNFNAESVISSGLVQIDPKITPGHLPAFIDKAEKRIRIFVPWFTEPLALKEIFQQKIKDGVSIEIFLMDPDSVHLEQRGLVVQPSKADYGRQEASRSLLTMKETFESGEQENVHIYAMKSLPSAMMVQADDKAYFGFYMHRGVATQNPIMTLDTERDKTASLFGSMIDREFADLKRYSTDVDISSIKSVDGKLTYTERITK